MDFGGFLAERIERAHLTRIAFAKAIGSSSGFMTDVIKGRRTPPLDRLDTWADVLGVTGAERQQFLLLAGLAHIPDQAVRDMVANQLTHLQAEVDHQSVQIAMLTERVTAMEAKR